VQRSAARLEVASHEEFALGVGDQQRAPRVDRRLCRPGHAPRQYPSRCSRRLGAGRALLGPPGALLGAIAARIASQGYYPRKRGITTDSYHVHMVVRAVLRGVCAPIGASPAVALAVGGPTPRRGGTVKSDKMTSLA
jgi:hypothetical protein